MAKTSESNCAPSCRARTWVTTPAIVTGSRSGSSRLGHHDVVELQVAARAPRPPRTAAGWRRRCPAPARPRSPSSPGLPRPASCTISTTTVTARRADAAGTGWRITAPSASGSHDDARSTGGRSAASSVPSASSMWRSVHGGGVARAARRRSGRRRAGEQRRDGQAQLVDQVGGDQRAEQVRAALAEHLGQARARAARPAPRRGRPRRRRRAARRRLGERRAGRGRAAAVREHDRPDRRLGEAARASGRGRARRDHHQRRVLGEPVRAPPGPALLVEPHRAVPLVRAACRRRPSARRRASAAGRRPACPARRTARGAAVERRPRRRRW